MRRKNSDAASPRRGTARAAVLATSVVALFSLSAIAEAEPIKIGSVKVAAFAALFVAQEKGYFAAEGIPAELVLFNAGLPIALGVTSSDLDFGATAATAVRAATSSLSRRTISTR